GPVIELVRVPIVRVDRRDVVLLARGRGQAARFLEGGSALLQHRRAGRLPERIVDAHRDAPVGHRAIGVAHGDRGERLYRLLVPEGVEQRDRALEIRLDRGRARGGEVYGAELLTVVGEGAGGTDQHRGDEHRGDQGRDQ